MFDPNKYDNTDSQNNGEGKMKFSEKVINIIKDLQRARPLIVKECELMEDYIKSNPDGKAKEPFKEKLAGWSRIINGLAIVKDMYKVE